MSRRESTVLGVLLLALALLWPGAASALPGSSPHATVDITTTTTVPGASAGLGYAGRYHAADDPDGEPPALRRLVIELPAGTKIDTSVPGRCTASDLEIKLQGESACPQSARVGTGGVTVNQVGLGTATYDTVIYNAKDELLELVKSGDSVIAVVHTHIRGTTLDGPVDTCLTGGNPPTGCPFDQVIVLSNHLQTTALSRDGRNYGTTPPTCPRSGAWQTPVTLHFGDGSVDTVITRQPCTQRPRGKA